MIETLLSSGSKKPGSATGPGPKTPIYGDDYYGYYGTVPTSEMILPEDIVTQLGITQGTALNVGTDWLKFAHQGKIKYFPKLPIRREVTWGTIYRAGAAYPVSEDVGKFPPPTGPVSQNKIVTGKGYSFDIYLPTSTVVDPGSFNVRYRDDSEYYSMLIRITSQWDKAEPWGSYEQYELGITQPHIYCWLRESYTDTYRLCGTGMSAGSIGGYGLIEDTRDIIHWRPVLELITEG